MKAMAAIVCLLAVMFMGCTGLQVGTTFNQPCTIYQDFGASPTNSLIAQKIANPCAAQKLLATAAKMPAVWLQAKYIDQFNKWAGVIHNKISSGISYADLQGLVVAEVAKFNAEAGLALLIVSDSLFVFEGQVQPIMPIDQKLLLASLNDLRVQVATLSLVAK